MTTQKKMGFRNTVLLSTNEATVPIDVWTMDELDQYADLDSVRSAWINSHDPN